MNKEHFEILKNIAESGTVGFESYMLKYQHPMKDVYDVLKILKNKKILIVSDVMGEYNIDNEKMIELLKPLALKFHDKTIDDVYKLAEMIEVSDLDFIKRLVNQEKVLVSEERSNDQEVAINRMLRDRFIIKCQNQYILSLNTELSRLLIEKVLSDEPKDDGFKKRYKEFAEMSYEDVLKRFKKS